MSKKSDGGPAFPAEGPSAGQFENPGMSLHDWFAGQALTGIIAFWETWALSEARESDDGSHQFDEVPKSHWHRRASISAYHYAAAMIAEREK